MAVYEANGYDVPVKQTQWKGIPFNVVLDAIKSAPRPVSLAEVAFHLTGFKGNQHLINPGFSGRDTMAKRRSAGLKVAHKVGQVAYWTVS